jgi:hypothetical protein
MGSGAKSYMWKGFLICSMRKCANISPYKSWPLVIYDFAPDPSEFSFIFFIISVIYHTPLAAF